jgi:predicted RNA-binding protein with PUA-like domain
MNYWLIKSEPIKYSWEKFALDKTTCWDGVRNYTARINLRAMKKGDLALFYHSNDGMKIVGIAKIIKEAYQDPTTPDDRWVAVNVQAVKPLKKFVTLATMKEDEILRHMQLVKISRLSVCAVTDQEFARVIELGETKV